MSWGEREDVGTTDDGNRVTEDANGDHWTVTHESHGGTPEANHASTEAEIEQAENNSR